MKKTTRTTRGMHHPQTYTPAHDPMVRYDFEVNDTDYFISLSGIQIATGRFTQINGKDPGSSYMYDQAVKMIESFYRSEHLTVHNDIAGASSTPNAVLWRQQHTKISNSNLEKPYS